MANVCACVCLCVKIDRSIKVNIGQELLKRTSGGDTMDFATERERTETSAHLHGEYVTSNGGAEGYLGQY